MVPPSTQNNNELKKYATKFIDDDSKAIKSKTNMNTRRSPKVGKLETKRDS